MDNPTLQSTIAGYRFLTTTGQVAVASASETALAYFLNPVGNTKNILLNKLRFGLNSTTIGTVISIYINPSPTANGTALTLANCNLNSGTVSTANVFKSPTSATKGTLVAQYLYLGNTVAPEKDFMMYLTPGKSILITVTNTSATSVNIHSDFDWLEQ